jgi:hypothetical protein
MAEPTRHTVRQRKAVFAALEMSEEVLAESAGDSCQETKGA